MQKMKGEKNAKSGSSNKIYQVVHEFFSYAILYSCTKQVESLMNWHAILNGGIGIVMFVKEIHCLSYIHRNNWFLHD